MTKIFDKQEENTTQLIIPDDTTSIVYQPILLFCFLIWRKSSDPFLQAFMATVLPVCNVQCLQLVDICVLRNISWFLYVDSSLIFQQHYDCWGWSSMRWDCYKWELLKTEVQVVVACLESPLQNLLGCTEEEHDKYHQCKQCLNQN